MNPPVCQRPHLAASSASVELTLSPHGVDYKRGYTSTADYVHRVLPGAEPADLPVEQPSSVEMVLNLKTARALGIAIPGSIRLRADEVIG